MRIRMPRWIRIMFGGALLLGSQGAGCMADALRDWSNQLDEYADDMDGETDFEDVVEDIEDWFD